MYIFSSDELRVINSENAKHFDIHNNPGTYLYTLSIDGVGICSFATEDEARKELKKMVDCMIENAPTYQMK